MVKKAQDDEVLVNEEQGEDSRKKKPVGPKGPGGLLKYALITSLGVIISMLVGLGTIHFQVLSKANTEQGNRLAQVYAEQYAGYYNQFFGQITAQVAKITGDAALAALLLADDPAALAGAQSRIAASLPAGSRVFLVASPAGITDIPLGFAAQEIVERARRGETVNPEIIPQPEQPLLLMAASIRDAGGQPVGAMLVGFNLKEVDTGLKAFDPDIGYMTLLQKVDDEPPTDVMRYGDKAIAASPYAADVTTAQPNLSVRFSLRPELAGSTTTGLLMLFAAGMMLLVLATIFLTGIVLVQAVRRNTSMLMQYAESLILRRPIPAGIIFTIDVFNDAAASLMRTARSMPADSPARTSSSPSRQFGRDSLDMATEETDLEPDDSPGQQGNVNDVPAEIFRAYDIRGVVGRTLTEDIVRLIGKAIGSEALDHGEKAIHVGRDGRLSGPQLLGALIDGIASTGCNVINIGMVPTPVVYFAAATSQARSGVMLTGSHNPPDYNGLKIVIGGETLADDRIQSLRLRILRGDLHSGTGSVETQDVSARYLERIKDDIVLARPLKVVVDCGNGIAGAIAPQLFTGIGCQVIPLFCDVDGNFPNHHPDPSKEDNLRDVIAKVLEEKADLGLAFDGDGDRVGVVTPQGKVIWPDRLMMLYSRDILMRNPGADIIFDVKCTRDLAQVIAQHGGRPVMWKTGHSLIKAKLKETGAALAGEMSGHIFFNDRWPGFDDGLYAATRLLEILSLEVANADEVFAEFPSNLATPELHINVTEEAKFGIIEALQKRGEFPGGSVNTIDGVRVDYPNAWGLVRASNTTPVLVARFEGKTEEDLETVRNTFREQLLKIEPSLRIGF